ncbi:MAG: endonuclease/exonuclease/phosphatase family protein [Faecalibacterium sp.]|nr:endonuclease/exonuclease/phosphatase family protein [Ruminococcus sp.]MCM1391282.1 endonuclease/exonuclease/phosphatase family protein [Ruminococcus sp.]MCM1484744.1 endonuclease/exonuclease/phosphatase family protein [Faecalibacterium sp.]
MKTFKKALSVFLAAMMALSVFCVCASATTDSVSVNMLCYNVAGLPDINAILKKDNAKDVDSNQAQLGAQLGASDYDVIAVQEDFGYHSSLVKGMDAYPYKTIHTGGIPGGDGMNIFSKTPIYNEKRTTWNMAYGVINDGADELTPKGILYAVLDLGNGIYVDFYNIHADAYDDVGSQKAREDNFKQLAAMINSRKTDRPVIVTGDFNTSSHIDNGPGFDEYMIEECGLKDAWTELYNDGNYEDYSKWAAQYGGGFNYWGKWDSVEKFLYKDGGGVHVSADSFEYLTFRNSDGDSISDHNAASAKISFTKTADFVENTEKLTVTKENKFNAFIKKISVIMSDLTKIFAHIDDLIAFLK